jgi:hypothetical protein
MFILGAYIIIDSFLPAILGERGIGEMGIGERGIGTVAAGVYGTMVSIGKLVGGIVVPLSIPIQLKEIGPAYAGTAGGFASTLQLLGAVIIPSYIAGTIAGTELNKFCNYSGVEQFQNFFLLSRRLNSYQILYYSGYLHGCVFLFIFGLPELGSKGKAYKEAHS